MSSHPTVVDVGGMRFPDQELWFSFGIRHAESVLTEWTSGVKWSENPGIYVIRGFRRVRLRSCNLIPPAIRCLRRVGNASQNLRHLLLQQLRRRTASGVDSFHLVEPAASPGRRRHDGDRSFYSRQFFVFACHRCRIRERVGSFE